MHECKFLTEITCDELYLAGKKQLINIKKKLSMKIDLSLLQFHARVV